MALSMDGESISATQPLSLESSEEETRIHKPLHP